MPKEKKEHAQAAPCWWCSDEGLSVYIEAKDTMTTGGVFGDFDWTGVPFVGGQEGIPVCGGCGGLGVQYPTSDFQERTEKIQKLRSEYADAVYKEQNPQKQLEAIQSLEAEVKELVGVYGHGKDNSFAHAVSEGLLQGRIDYLKGLL